MKQPLNSISTAELAACTGHKLTGLHRAPVSGLLGMVYFGKLDKGPFRKLSDIRQELESAYLAAEARQGKRVTS